MLTTQDAPQGKRGSGGGLAHAATADTDEDAVRSYETGEVRHSGVRCDYVAFIGLC